MRDIVATDITRNLPMELVNKIMLYRPPNAYINQLKYYKKEWTYQSNRESPRRFRGTLTQYIVMKNLQKKGIDTNEVTYNINRRHPRCTCRQRNRQGVSSPSRTLYIVHGITYD